MQLSEPISVYFQIILYDSSKNQIDKRFLKKDEVISSGESLTFDAHLVDIGDPIGTDEGDSDGKIKEKNCSTTEKSKIAGPQWQKLSSGIYNCSWTPLSHIS